MKRLRWIMIAAMTLITLSYISVIKFFPGSLNNGRGHWMFPKGHQLDQNYAENQREEPTAIIATNINKQQKTANTTIISTKLKINQTFPSCPDTSPHLIGNRTFNLSMPVTTEGQLEQDNPLVQQGGSYTPENCIPKYRVAVIIPFRNREFHLLKFLQYMHPLFQRKQLNYKIYIINEIDGAPFNRAKLMNVGFAESLKEGFDCFVFHDVDMILEDDRCPITCSGGPVHLGLYVDKYEYRAKIGTLYMGGVAQFSKEQYLQINGMCNSYWGWGGEDDDVYYRTKHENLQIERYPICRYSMIKHEHDEGNMPNPARFELLQGTQRNFKTDGINSLVYKIIARGEHRLYTNITVDLLAPRPPCLSYGDCHRNQYYKIWYPQVREDNNIT